MADSRDPIFPLRLDAADRALAEGISRVEKLSMSDSIRRSIRAYAKQLKVKVKGTKG